MQEKGTGDVLEGSENKLKKFKMEVYVNGEPMEVGEVAAEGLGTNQYWYLLLSSVLRYSENFVLDAVQINLAVHE